MEYLVTKTIPREELTEYKDYIGFLFKNENGVFNICDNEEDIIKSNQWFKNFPLKTLVVAKSEISIGDKFLAICSNQNLNGKVFTYVGITEGGVDLIDIKGDDGKESISPKTLLDGSYKFIRRATREDKEKLVNGKITEFAV